MGDEGFDEAAARCINFMVRSLEDMAFGAFEGVLGPLDIVVVVVSLSTARRIGD